MLAPPPQTLTGKDASRVCRPLLWFIFPAWYRGIIRFIGFAWVLRIHSNTLLMGMIFSDCTDGETRSAIDTDAIVWRVATRTPGI
jgi:hypothetical protein